MKRISIILKHIMMLAIRLSDDAFLFGGCTAVTYASFLINQILGFYTLGSLMIGLSFIIGRAMRGGVTHAGVKSNEPSD